MNDELTSGCLAQFGINYWLVGWLPAEIATSWLQVTTLVWLPRQAAALTQILARYSSVFVGCSRGRTLTGNPIQTVRLFVCF